MDFGNLFPKSFFVVQNNKRYPHISQFFHIKNTTFTKLFYTIGSNRKEGEDVQFRHEVKYEISKHDILILRQRLRSVMKPDYNTVSCEMLGDIVF